MGSANNMAKLESIIAELPDWRVAPNKLADHVLVEDGLTDG